MIAAEKLSFPVVFDSDVSAFIRPGVVADTFVVYFAEFRQLDERGMVTLFRGRVRIAIEQNVHVLVVVARCGDVFGYRRSEMDCPVLFAEVAEHDASALGLINFVALVEQFPDFPATRVAELFQYRSFWKRIFQGRYRCDVVDRSRHEQQRECVSRV